jgi:hypothetical protein
MKVLGAFYFATGFVLSASVLLLYYSMSVTVALCLALAATAFIQALTYYRYGKNLESSRYIESGYMVEPSSKQIYRLIGLSVIQLPVVGGLLAIQFLFFNWISERSDSGIAFGPILLAVVSGAFVGYGLSSMAMGIWTGRWERDQGRLVLEQSWPRKSDVSSGPPLGRVFVAAP